MVAKQETIGDIKIPETIQTALKSGNLDLLKKDVLKEEIMRNLTPWFKELAEMFSDKKLREEFGGGLFGAFLAVMQGMELVAPEEGGEATNEENNPPQKPATKAQPAQKPTTEEKEPEPEFRVCAAQREPEVEAPSEEYAGKKWDETSILDCSSIDECRAFMKAQGYEYDGGSGNYLNPKYLTKRKILQEPLVTYNFGRTTVKLKKSVMAALLRASNKCYKETGQHIFIGDHFRSNEKQFNTYKKLRSSYRGKDKKIKRPQVARPGNSFHETGQAIDVPNWKVAEPYLLAEGFIGGSKGMANDRHHFSMGEMGSLPVGSQNVA